MNASNSGRERLLWTAGIVSSLVMLDSNLVAVSLPSIASSLNASFSAVEWVVSAYVLPFTALLLAAGSFADLKGRRRAMLLGVALFTLASAACGFAPSVTALNAARVFQGVGAALLLTASLAVINHAFRGVERARAYAFWGACLGVAITMGPIVGGLINDSLGWRWAFLINLPIGAILFWATLANIPESRDPEACRLDVGGVLTVGSALFLLTLALIEGNALGWTSKAILSCLAGSALLFAMFLAVERVQRRPMLDLSLFKSRTFLGAGVAMIGYAAGAQVLVFFLPLVLQGGYGFAPAEAGLAMLPFALPMFLAPRLTATLAGRYPGRILLGAGLALTWLADTALAFASSAQFPAFAAAMILAGTGAGLLNSETAKVLQGTVPADRGGMASGISATVRFTGLLVGVAGLGAVFDLAALHTFSAWAATENISSDVAMAAAKRFAAGDASHALVNVPEVLHGAALEAGRQAASAAFSSAVAIAAAIAAVAGILTLRLMPAEPSRQLCPPHALPVAAE